jgi:hypothetical protein
MKITPEVLWEVMKDVNPDHTDAHIILAYLARMAKEKQKIKNADRKS